MRSIGAWLFLWLFAASVALAAQDVLPLHAQIEALLDRHDDRQALELADRAVAQAPRSSEAFRLRSVARRRLGDRQGGLADARRAVDLDPASSRAWSGLAGARAMGGDLRGALGDVTRALELDPKSASAYWLRAELFHATSRLPAARADIDRAIAIDPRQSAYHHRRALVRAQQNDAAGALQDVTTALDLDPRAWEARFDRATLLAAMRRFPEAAEDFSRCIDAGHRVADALNGRGVVRRDAGDRAGAARDFEAAVRIDPRHAEARANLATTAGATAAPPGTTPPAAPPPARSVLDLPAAVLEPSAPSEDALWAKPGRGRLRIPTNAPPVELGPAPAVTHATGKLSLGHVRFAMEGMRALAGPLSPEQSRRFDAKWQPYFADPHPEAVAYFAAMGPRLTELMAVKGVVARSAGAFDHAWAEAVAAYVTGDTIGAAEALEIAFQHQRQLQAANTRLVRIATDVEALGSPPNPHEAKKRAREEFGRPFERPAAPAAVAAAPPRPAPATARSGESKGSFTITQTYVNPRFGNRVVTISGSLSSGATITDPGPSSGKFPDGPFNGLQVTAYSITGAQLGAPKDSTGFTYGRAFQGRLTGDTLTVSGATTDLYGTCNTEYGSFKFRLDVSVTLNGVTREYRSPEPCDKPAGTPKYEVKQGPGRFSVTVGPGSPAAPAQAPAGPAVTVGPTIGAPAGAEAIKEKETWIAIIERNLAKDEEEYARERDERRAAELYLRILNGKSDLQHEKDLLHTLKTGQLIHTRTAADAYVHDLMIVRAEQQMAAAEQKIANIQAAAKVAGALAWQLFKAPDDQRQQLQAFVARNLTAQDLAAGNVAKAKQVTGLVVNAIQARHEQDAARELLDSISSDEYFTGAERIRNGATVSLMILGLGAPVYWAAAGTTPAGATTALMRINAIYGTMTGGIEGGLGEAVKQAVALTSLPGMVAAEMMNGYRHGALLTSGGVPGALERGLEAFMLGKAIEAGAGWLGQRAAQLKGASGPAPPAVKRPPTVAELIDQASYKMVRQQAQRKIDRFKEVSDKIRQARSTTPPAAELSALEAERTRLVVQMNEDYMAKRLLKAQGKAGRATGRPTGDARYEHEFAQTTERIHATQVDPAFRREVRETGYHWRRRTPDGRWENAGGVEFKDFRHAASEGTLNTDRDYGIIEKTGEGIYQLYRGNTKVPLSKAADEMQAIYERVYQQTTGGNAKAAMHQVTASTSGDAYRDMTYTRMGCDPQSVHAINKGWVEQAAEVSRHKIALPGSGDPLADTVLHKIHSANEAAKDVRERLLPYLRGINAPAEHQRRFQAIGSALAEVERDPVGASRKLRVLTGTDSISEVSDLISRKFVGAVKLGRP